MPITQRPEIAFVVQNILPLFATQYGYPNPDDEEHTKIQEIPVRIASETKKTDVVYYWQQLPVLLIEAKKEGKSEEDAVDQALSYIRNFPVAQYSKDGIRPRYFAVTIGRLVHFYAHRYEIQGNIFRDWAEKLENPVLFHDLLTEYGLEPIHQKDIFSPEIFRKEILNELGPLYKFEETITPAVVKNITHQILSFLQYGVNYTSHRPYIDLDGSQDRQTQIRRIYNKFDWENSLGPEMAKEFRSYILRSFQGTNLNQYLTEQCVIAFMFDLVDDFSPESKLLDFECGSGGFLVAAVDHGLNLENILGVDIDELPYLVSKTYLALYFKNYGRDQVETLPVKKDNGLYYHGNDWDYVMGNPAGGSRYELDELNRVGENLNRDLDGNGVLDDNLSEYNLSIQQAVQSTKIGGRICLVLPEGFFSNSNDDFLRKYVAKHCKILAVISLPRGVFKKGTSTRRLRAGAQSSWQKMSILYAEKNKAVIHGKSVGELDISLLGYPVFLASATKADRTGGGSVCEWLEPKLNIVLEQWKEWKKENRLSGIEVFDIQEPTIDELATSPLPEPLPPQSQQPQPRAPEPKSKTWINNALRGIFGQNSDS